MDPKQTLLDACAALRTGDPDDVREALKNYRAWRKRGGFEPTFAVEPPAFYADSFRKPVGGDAVAKSIGSALRCKSRLTQPAYLGWIK